MVPQSVGLFASLASFYSDIFLNVVRLVSLSQYIPAGSVKSEWLANQQPDPAHVHLRQTKEYQEGLKKALQGIKENKKFESEISCLKGVFREQDGKIHLSFTDGLYSEHLATQSVWCNYRKLDGQYFTGFNPVYSTSFGLHIGVITSDNKFVLCVRSAAVATPNAIQCGAVESMASVRNDHSPYDTAVRGLDEELAIRVKAGQAEQAVKLLTLYLKYDRYEAGMGGVLDLRDEQVKAQLTDDSPHTGRRMPGETLSCVCCVKRVYHCFGFSTSTLRKPTTF